MAIKRPTKEEKLKVKTFLIEMLKKEGVFWSYSEESLTTDNIDDDSLIAWTMRYLDLKEIEILFTIYSKLKVKSAWRKLLVPEGEYLYTLNRFFAWYYFGSKRPDAYLKSLETRHINSLFK